jgi:hypothetical protein
MDSHHEHRNCKNNFITQEIKDLIQEALHSFFENDFFEALSNLSEVSCLLIYDVTFLLLITPSYSVFYLILGVKLIWNWWTECFNQEHLTQYLQLPSWLTSLLSDLLSWTVAAWAGILASEGNCGSWRTLLFAWG